MQFISAFIAGLLFGVGLTLSGMTNPAKVIGFLDISGHWDPSLAGVMLGAISVAIFAFQIAKKRQTTFLGLPIQLPAGQVIDTPLIAGAAIFGIGWGLVGYCPGPSIAALFTGASNTWVFVIAMLAGMMLYEMIRHIQLKLPK